MAAQPSPTTSAQDIQTIAVLSLSGTTVTATVPPSTSGVAVVDGTTISFRHEGITLSDGEVFSLGFDGLVASTTTASYEYVSVPASQSVKYDSTRHPTGTSVVVTDSQDVTSTLPPDTPLLPTSSTGMTSSPGVHDADDGFGDSFVYLFWIYDFYQQWLREHDHQHEYVREQYFWRSSWSGEYQRGAFDDERWEWSAGAGVECWVWGIVCCGVGVVGYVWGDGWVVRWEKGEEGIVADFLSPSCDEAVSFVLQTLVEYLSAFRLSHPNIMADMCSFSSSSIFEELESSDRQSSITSRRSSMAEQHGGVPVPQDPCPSRSKPLDRPTMAESQPSTPRALDPRAPCFEATNFTNDTRLVRFTIGHVKAAFMVHARFLSKSSMLVKQHLGRTRKDLSVVAMPRLINVSPPTFNIYVNWLYSGRLYCLEENDHEDEDGGVQLNPSSPHYSSAEDPQFILLARLYALRVRLRDAHFQNTILSAILAKVEDPATRSLPGSTAIDIFFEKCGKGSEGMLGRELMVKVWVRYAGVVEHFGVGNRGFLEGEVGELMRGRKEGEEGREAGLDRGRFCLRV
ncbi:hypothetical protein M409DRAFT_52109 [Zasmidium cellare ATCC 36951]|uniref:BTB domain-containing protein n=1 Tax=Zasmidium cellare ATCC 36951 TaxID=1080233 RepID=A0A6A6CR63_ZASCE|nr:uncharacterized protein M409DRAFT_52109 [Zasmidium cellare ATCC 36951]KAF2169575.1 hypothetical protein M409DRAFT_52109 [Zasmidium cellare ATCC 36951]